MSTSQQIHRALYGLEGVDLNAQQRLVLIFIADHVNDETGLAWMSLQRVATFAGMRPYAVRRAIGGLKDAGVLDVVERPGRTSLYRIMCACGECGTVAEDADVIRVSHMPVLAALPEDLACAWAEYRNEYGVRDTTTAYKAFVAGWNAAHGLSSEGILK